MSRPDLAPSSSSASSSSLSSSSASSPSSLQSLPGSLAYVPIAPRASHIVLGICLVVLSAWLMAVWLPRHHPMESLEALRFIEDGAARGIDRSRHWVLAAWLYPWTFVLAGVLGCIGLGRILSGATYRPFKEVVCERCVTRVLARKQYRGLRCPLGAHYARRTHDPLALILLVPASIAALALVAHLSA